MKYMAEEQQKTDKGKKLLAITERPIINRIKELSNKYLHTSFHYRKPAGQQITVVPTFTNLSKKIDFRAVGSLNEMMVGLERDWDGGLGKEHDNAGYLKEEVFQLYKKLGPYFDFDALDKEFECFDKGTGVATDSIKIKIQGLGTREFRFSVPQEKEIVFKHGLKYKAALIGVQNPTYITLLGKEINEFCDNIEAEFQNANMGQDIKSRMADRITLIKSQLENFLGILRVSTLELESRHRVFLESLKQEPRTLHGHYLEQVKTKRLLKPEQVKRRHTYRLIKPYTFVTIYYREKNIAIDEKFKNVFKIEEGKQSEIKVKVYFNPDINPLKDELDEVNDKLSRANRDEIIKDIKRLNYLADLIRKRILYLDKILTGRMDAYTALKAKYSNRLTSITSQINNLKSQLYPILELEVRKEQLLDFLNNPDLKPNPGNFNKKPNEVDFGLDENGWPLEVVDDKVYEWGGRILAPGTVLLDVFNGDANPRIVPYEFTEDCDLLDMAAWVYVSYDSLRDDLRDGRYHYNSLTVMEYIMQMKNMKKVLKKGNLDFNHVNTDMPKVNNKGEVIHTNAVMKLNTPGEPEVEVKVKPSHLNPALDLRVKDKDLHLGRKLYYDLQENLFDDMPKTPTLTTRGAALYILATAIEEVKTWDEILELLYAIGDNERTKGFDIGPNLQLTEEIVVENGKKKIKRGTKRWGMPLTRDPFKPV